MTRLLSLPAEIIRQWQAEWDTNGAEGPEDGVQLVRASDLMAWAAAIGKRYEVEE
jgi:hypothetical protein